MAPTEIVALARILGELNYYQLLHLDPKATPGQIKVAYHATSRAFHPDGNRFHEGEVRLAIDSIAKRITEAYSVLRNPQRRQAYDHQLSGSGATRMQLAEATAAGRQEEESRRGQTAQGRQYYGLAAGDLQRRDYAAAVRNLQTALTFEPGNDFFKQQLDRAKAKLNGTA